MKCFYLFIFFTPLIFCVKSDESSFAGGSHVNGYYWRDYTGYIPDDAIQAGRDENGEVSYIGQALHPGGHLTPGFIKQNNNNVFYESGNAEHASTMNVKILCSRKQERLTWVRVKYDQSANLNGVHLIIGGYSGTGPVFIGRKARENDEVAVGNAHIVDKKFSNLHTTTLKKVGRIDHSYEVLAYKTAFTNDEGYYWRDYIGYIPKDAVPAGRDENGETTFIGQALHPGGFLTPGFIKQNNNNVFYESANREHQVADYVKILCSRNQEKLSWIKVKSEDSINNLGGEVVVAGSHNDGPLAIGRIARQNNEVSVGKAVILGTKFEKLFTTRNTVGSVSNSYEVLVYKPERVKHQGYYWKDYTGDIPKDAISAGRDENGQTTFIGQAIHTTGLPTPGFIKKNDNHVFYEYGGIERAVADNVKILCSQNPEKLMWIKVNHGQSTNNLHNRQIIIGGRDADGLLAIGRKERENNEIAVGKAILSWSKEYGYLYTTENNVNVLDTSYEVLVFKTPVIEENGICTKRVVQINLFM